MNKHVIRNSDRNAFKNCRRAWDWKSPLRRNLIPRVTPKPLEFGIAWHIALAFYYNPDTWHLRSEPAKWIAVEEGTIRTFVDAVKEQKKKYEEDRDLFIELEEDFNERLELGQKMLRAYFAWSLEHDTFTVRKVEVGFEVPIPDPRSPTEQLWMPSPDNSSSWPVVYQGRLDGIVTDPQGWNWLKEHKTTGQFGDMKHLDLDEQLTSYGWALRQVGVNVRGALYTEALKDFSKGVKVLQSRRQGRLLSVNKQSRITFEEFKQAVVDYGEDPNDYIDHLAYLQGKPNPFFRRFAQFRTTQEYDEIGTRIGWEAIDMLSTDTPLYPNPGRFNCSFCSFREPCLAFNQGNDSEFLLKELFIKGETRVIEVDTKYE